MNFRDRKLPPEASQQMRMCPIVSVAPFALMLAPVYVFMKANEKFVAVKAPLDFFTPEELARLKPFQSFFLPEFVEKALPFREAAREVKTLLSWVPKISNSDVPDDYEEASLPPSPYELSDAVVRIIGPLWGSGAVIEPFFVSVFANELCDLLSPEVLLKARDEDVAQYEKAIFRSSWSVFLALHLGHCNLTVLNQVRRRVYDETMARVKPEARVTEVDEVVAISAAAFDDPKLRIFRGDSFEGRGERAAQRIAGRMDRVSSEMIRKEEVVPSIYGPGGFADV